MLTELDIYLFDLRGYLVIEQALGQNAVAALNAGIDAILPLKRGEWAGYVHGHGFSDNDGLNLQQIYEGGEPFERLIDHPAWIDKVKYFVGGEGTFDYQQSPLFIDEKMANTPSISLHDHGECNPEYIQSQGEIEALNPRIERPGVSLTLQSRCALSRRGQTLRSDQRDQKHSSVSF